jgi:phosphatidylserine/phosphatidylglycerophosphate/cardiolipin synthase-like enzyme
MKVTSSSGPLSAQAIAGNDVVLIGIDHERAAMPGIHGFGIERLDHTEGEHRWLPNRLRFTGAPAGAWTTDVNPLQTFLWGDYTAKPGHDYTYIVHSLAGTPGQVLTSREEVTLPISTGQPGTQGVWFNRGAISSQAYAERFHNAEPQDVPNDAAWIWLSRGLEEALLAFIGRALDASWELHGCFYEFQLPAVLDAFGVAARAGASVKLIVDDGNPKNHDAVSSAGIGDLIALWRAHAKIPHNKFIVASHAGTPVAVWTGSTNVTLNGVFGQSNVGHSIDDPAIAAAYLAYWTRLLDDPPYSALNDWVDANDALPDDWPGGVSVVFSPHTHSAALDRYASLFSGAGTIACGTFPFTLDSRFGDALPGTHDALRYLLFEDAKAAAAAAEAVTDPKTAIVAGAFLPAGALAGFVEEMRNPLSTNVEYVHSKYLLIDPLGDDPVVVTGSANFSVASTTGNDENMLVIRGNSAVAEAYLTEFMRLFDHYRFRYTLSLRPHDPTPGPQSGVVAAVGLDPTDAWWAKYYDEPGRARQREVLAGTAH